MALPKIEYALYEIYLHSLDRKVKFRPFLVKEEKILLMAKESKDPNSIKLAIMQVIQNCAAEPLEVEKLPLFDIEMLFVKLRAKSVGESVRLVFSCKNIVADGSECNGETDYTLDLEKVAYDIPEGHDPQIMITDTVGIRLKYPTIDSTLIVPPKNEDDGEEAYDLMLRVLLDSIEYIFDGESVTRREACTDSQLIEFIESITPEVFEKIRGFFKTSPTVTLTDKVTCKKCGFEHTLHTESLLDFFI
jgi:hypothetical protein